MKLGQVKHLYIKIDKPIKMEAEIDYNNIAIFVGQNGSGKTLLLKLIWVTSFISLSFIEARKKKQNFNTLELGQFTFDSCFDNQIFNGTIKTYYNNGDLEIILDNGKIQDIIINFDDTIDSASFPIFMSKDLRTFDNIHRYLKLRKTLKINGNLNVNLLEEFKELQGFYKLYDIMYVERLLTQLKHQEYEVTQKFKDTLSNYDLDKLKIKSFGFNEIDSYFYYLNEDDDKINLSTLSAGEQSLINIFLCNALNS